MGSMQILFAAGLGLTDGFELRLLAIVVTGEMWLFWNASLNLSVIKTHPQFLHVQINKHGTSLWLLRVVYASPNPTLRKLLYMA